MAITHEAWLKALQDARDDGPRNDPDAKTVVELCELWGLKDQQARRMAKKLVAMGRAETVRKMVQTADGGWRPIPAYKLKP